MTEIVLTEQQKADRQRYKEILEKQLELLSERSNSCEDGTLDNITEAMIQIINTLNALRP